MWHITTHISCEIFLFLKWMRALLIWAFVILQFPNNIYPCIICRRTRLFIKAIHILVKFFLSLKSRTSRNFAKWEGTLIKMVHARLRQTFRLSLNGRSRKVARQEKKYQQSTFNVQALNLYLTIYTETEGTRYLSYIKAGTFWV